MIIIALSGAEYNCWAARWSQRILTQDQAWLVSAVSRSNWTAGGERHPGQTRPRHRWPQWPLWPPEISRS